MIVVLWKVIKEMRMSDTLSASCETCMQVKKQQVEMELQQQTGRKVWVGEKGKGDIKRDTPPAIK